MEGGKQVSPILPAGCLGMGRGSQLWWGSFPVEDAAGMQERLALASRSLGDCLCGKRLRASDAVPTCARHGAVGTQVSSR